ncbi:MAG: ABC transporter ATP-binding protein [Thermomicrobiales bacterium]
MSDAPALLELQEVTKRFRLPDGTDLSVLRGIDLTVEPGSVTAIIGRSGSGKSTLLNVLGLLDAPSSGTFRCNGIDATAMNDAQRSRLRGSFLGFVFQQFFLLDRRTALENVAEPMLFGSRADLRKRFDRAQELLDLVGLTDRAQSMPHLLSGGEQQRVAIARALMRSPRVVLADEPTGALDETTGERVLDLLMTLVREVGVALILVTHDRDVARRAGRILTLHEGRLHQDDGKEAA